MISKRIFTLILLLFLASCQHKIEPIQLKEYVIGDVNTIVVEENYAQNYYAGLFMGIEEINKNGGVNGIPLKVEYKSDYANHREAYLKADYLVKNKNAIILSGTSIPQTTFGVARYAIDNKVPFIDTGSLSEEIITGQYVSPFVFRLREGYNLHIKSLVNEIASNSSIKSLVVLTYSSEEGMNLSSTFKDLMLKKRPDIMFAKDVYLASHKGIFDDITKEIQYSFTTGVVILINGEDIYDVMKNIQIKRVAVGKSVYLMMGGEPEWVHSLYSLTPQDWIVTGFPYYTIGSEANLNFIKKYRSKYNKVMPKHSSYIGYITAYIIADALKKARPVENDEKNREKLAKALEEASFSSPIGLIKMRKDHQSDMGLYVGLLHPYSLKIKGSNKTIAEVRMYNYKYINPTLVLDLPEDVNKIREKQIKTNKEIQKKKRHITPRVDL